MFSFTIIFLSVLTDEDEPVSNGAEKPTKRNEHSKTFNLLRSTLKKTKCNLQRLFTSLWETEVPAGLPAQGQRSYLLSSGFMFIRIN